MTAKEQKPAESREELRFVGKERGLWRDAFRRFARNKLSLAVSVVVLLLILTAVFAPWLAPTHYDKQVYDQAWEKPSARHWMGTDQYGRDVLSRIIYGARISLSVALVVNLVALLIGAPYGAIAGWFGGKVDYALMRFLDVMSAFPNLLLAILMMTILGSGLVNVFIAMSVTSWIGIARLIRGQILSLREQDYIMASRAIGAKNSRIILQHLIPNALVPVIVAVTLGVPSAIMGEAGLSFLGIGVNAPMPSWGKMLNEYMGSISSSWYLSVFPAIMIALTMYAFTLMGDGLQDALNPTASKNA
jgi:ABC-type dipeptide/oligopeptide/nickel transport system permease subunit